MIHSLLIDDVWCYWVISIGALFSFVGFIIACICSCRRNDNKSEFLGVAGMVTITHSDSDGFTRIAASSEAVHTEAQDSVDGSEKRSKSANRSLPDIPKDKIREDDLELGDGFYEVTENVGSDPLDLYATVQDKSANQLDRRNKQNVSQMFSSSLDETASLYARLQTPQTSSNDEHPYAQVQNVTKTENSRNPTSHVIDVSQPSTSTGLPVAPPRSRRSSSHNSLMEHQLQPSQSQQTQEIQAASAISGAVQANQDLPYMTPPIIMPPLPQPPEADNNGPQPHQNFSGDSQDSKGYTSISVREPLANIIAQTKSAQQQKRMRSMVDPHYATVSDDSDEMYAAIDEQDKIYTSGSETYAQIQPIATAADVNRPTSGEQSASVRNADIEAYVQAPQPPSVDSLRHVAHAHSRQASSSSASSSIVNPSSPKPEKRQANSPLPPPPENPMDMYAIIDKRNKTERASSATPGKSVEDMYAKVMKKKQQRDSMNDDEASVPSSPSSFPSEPTASTSSSMAPKARRKLSLIDSNRSSWSSHDSIEFQRRETTVSFISKNSNKDINFDDGYEAVMNITKVKRVSAPPIDTNYETLRPLHHAHISGGVRNEVEALPIYALPFKHRQISNASSEDPGYERVLLRRRPVNNDEAEDETYDSEPNYESMPHEPSYASVRSRVVDYEPNYESVSNGDPNYESVKYPRTASNNPEPPYEKLEPNYERISKDNIPLTDTDDEQYVQV